MLTPGDVNAHTHLYSGLAPFGLPVPVPAPSGLPEILRHVWWRLDRALDAASLAAAARYYAADALHHGTTTLIDHHESPRFIEGSLDVVADACAELGLRAVVCYGATERNGGREEAERGLAECARFMASNRRPGIRGIVGLHASFTASDETIREAGRLCRELGSVLHVHLAEDRCDRDDARARGYAGPLQRLDALGALVPGSILAHGVHLTEDEVRRADDRGCWLVHNPRSNDRNGVGYAAVLDAASRVALGTDGFPSAMSIEAEAASPPGQSGTAGARRLEAGHELAIELLGREAAPAGVVFLDPLTRLGPVARVVIGGRPIIEQGQLLTGDWDAIRAAAQHEAGRLWARMAHGE
jgi:cytosine/adenosine deaminase-related metal-dependent hydrolase